MDVDVLLVHPQYHRRVGSGIIPPIGLAYIAAALEAQGLTVAILDCALDCGSQSPAGLVAFRQYLDRRLPTITPKTCVGIGPTTTPALKSLHVLAQALQDNYPSVAIVYGGPFASIPSQASIFFDCLHATALIRGDGEEVFPRLVRALQVGEMGAAIAGVSWHKEQIVAAAIVPDADAITFPARHLLENDRYRPSLRRDVFANRVITPIYWSRGCPYRCNFCVSPMLRDNQVYRRSQANLLAEMQQCVQQFGITGFIFYDDCLFLQSPHLNAEVQTFCMALLDTIDVVIWEMELRADAVAALTTDSLRWLYDAGCRQINMGIEKASNQGLAALDKHLRVDQVMRACDHVKQTVPSLRLAGTFIIGGADETEADVESVIRFATSLPLDFAHFNPLAIYPGTPLFAEIFPDDLSQTAWANRMLQDKDNYWGELLYETKDLPAQRLLDLVNRAYETFYQPSRWHLPMTTPSTPQENVRKSMIIDCWSRDRFNLTADKEVSF